MEQGSTFLALGTIPTLIHGGSGSTPLSGPGSNGGAGLIASGSSRAHIEGFDLVGGTGGFGAKAGPKFVKDSSSSVLVDVNSWPAIARMTDEPTRGKTVDLWLDARPNSVGLLVLGTRSVFVPLAPLSVGTLFVLPELILPPFAVPTSGKAKIPLPIASFLPKDLTFWAQLAAIEAKSARLWLTNSLALTVR